MCIRDRFLIAKDIFDFESACVILAEYATKRLVHRVRGPVFECDQSSEFDSFVDRGQHRSPVNEYNVHTQCECIAVAHDFCRDLDVVLSNYQWSVSNGFAFEGGYIWPINSFCSVCVLICDRTVGHDILSEYLFEIFDRWCSNDMVQ